MSERNIGRAWVIAQFVLLVVLILLPGGGDWRTPWWVDALGFSAVGLGLAVVAIGGRGLGSALTPTPVPNEHGRLSTDGPYRFVRHPIYSGVLLVVVGLVVRSGSLLTLMVGFATFVFFDRKAAWEERRLVARYDGYEAYAERTPRFVPRFGRSEVER